MNRDAARHALGKRPQSWWAIQAGVSTANLSYLINGAQGCSHEIAQRLADAVEVPVGMLFPELCEFDVEVRRFTASKIGDAA